MKLLVITLLCLVGLSYAQVKSVDTPCPSENKFGLEGAERCCSDATDCQDYATSRIVDNKSKSKYDNFIRFSNEFLVRSYEYLFLSAQFGTYGKDRPGFHKLLHELSDNSWNKGIEMIKEMAKRGFVHHFEVDAHVLGINSAANVTELVALAKAAEIEKSLLIAANNIHRHHSHASFEAEKSCGYDAGLAHYIEEEIIEEKTSTVRSLTGHVNQLKRLFAKDPKTYPLSLFMYDQHLQ